MPTIQKRSYKQNCALSKGLDQVGGRWTFLIVRELLIGPKRYKDLLDGLLGMGTNLLAERLKTLKKSGLIEQTILPPPAASTVYQLSRRGRQLEEVILTLTRWGFQFLDKKRPDERSCPEWDLLAMKAAFRPEKAEGITLCCEWHVDALIFHTRVDKGRLEITLGAAKNPIATVRTDGEIFSAVGLGKKSLKEVIVNGDFKITGSGLAVVRMMQILCIMDSGTESERS